MENVKVKIILTIMKGEFNLKLQNKKKKKFLIEKIKLSIGNENGN
jgi:hypothetical protein